MSARIGATTGNGLVSLIREQFSLRLATFSVGCLLVANLGLVVSEFAGIGAAMELLGVSRYLAVPLAAIGVWAVVIFGSYRYAERVLVLLSLVFLAYPIAAILGHPDWTQVAANTVWPHLEANKEFLFLTVALIGTTITPYMQLYQTAAVVERGAGPDDLRDIRIDSISGSVFACIISMAIIIATAAAIGGTGALDSAAEAAQALEPVAGAAAKTLFAVGLLGASLLAAAVVPAGDVLRPGRSHRRRAQRLAPVPRRQGLPRAVHGPDRRRRRHRPRPRQPHQPAAEHAVPQRARQPDPARLHPRAGQPPQPHGRQRQLPQVPGPGHGVHRRPSPCSPPSSPSRPCCRGSASADQRQMAFCPAT